MTLCYIVLCVNFFLHGIGPVYVEFWTEFGVQLEYDLEVIGKIAQELY